MKKRYILASILLVFIIIFSLAESKKLNNFFIQDYYVHGVDVSHYQGEINMSTLKTQNIDFVYIKATEGSKSTDEKFKENWENAQNSGLYAGAYHFFSFDSDGLTQANHYIETVGELHGNLIPAVDVEYYANKQSNPPSKQEMLKQLTIYITTVEKYYGVKPMIYSTPRFYYRYIHGAFDDYPLWIRSVNYPAHAISARQWTLWQYNDEEILDGYTGTEKHIDKNVFHGDLKKLTTTLLVP